MHTRATVVQIRQPCARLPIAVLACLAIQLRGSLVVLRDTLPSFDSFRLRETALGLAAVARLIEETERERIVTRNAGSRGPELPESEAPEGDLRIARSRQQRGGVRRILPNAVTRDVEHPQVRTSRHVLAVTRPLKECRGTIHITRHAGSVTMEQAEARASIRRAALARRAKEIRGFGGVALDASPALIGDAETGAPIADATRTRTLEECGGTRIIAEYVFAFLKPQRELVTRRRVAAVTAVAKSDRLCVSGMTCASDEQQRREGERR